MITTFPIFTPLTIKNRSEIGAITSRFEPYADFSFVNLHSWGMSGGAEVAMINNNLAIRLPDYVSGDTMMYSLIGDNEIDKTIREVLEYGGRLDLVPDVVVGHIEDPDSFTIKEDRDNFDYIYDVQSLATLKGGALKKKRNKTHKFLHDLGHVVKTDTLRYPNDATAEELSTVFKEWARSNNKTDEECQTEHMAFDSMLRNTASLGLLFTIVKLNNKICAFSVHELLENDKAICHFEKALPVHDCLYPFTIYYAANELAALGIQNVNWQQDLGLPGLRQAKMSYQPLKFLKKYSVTLS